MANQHPDITPTGINQKDFVDLLYMIVSSLRGICAKLDVDGGVPLTTYLANCYTAIFNIVITDSKNNRTGIIGDHIIAVNGMTDQAQVELLHQIFNSFETLTEQLDVDGLTGSDYEALVYTAKFLMNVTNGVGESLGNGIVYYFGPISPPDQAHLVDLLYIIVDAIETMTEKLDADGTVTDVNYEELWFTDNILMRVENSTGNKVGNTKPF